MEDLALPRVASSLHCNVVECIRLRLLLWSDASGDAMGYGLGPEHGSGVWWHSELYADVSERLRTTVESLNDLSINVLELLGMVVTACTFITQSNILPCYARDTILMPGEKTPAVQGVSKRRGVKEPRSGTLTPLLGCPEVGSGWWFDALHVAGVENTIPDDRSRWEPEAIDGNLRTFRPDVCLALASVSMLRLCLTEFIRQVSGRGLLFGG